MMGRRPLVVTPMRCRDRQWATPTRSASQDGRERRQGPRRGEFLSTCNGCRPAALLVMRGEAAFAPARDPSERMEDIVSVCDPIGDMMAASGRFTVAKPIAALVVGLTISIVGYSTLSDETVLGGYAGTVDGPKYYKVIN